jgi:hypothetical protein
VNEERAFRGLIPVFFLSFLNLAGILLTVTALGGLGDWSRWQFIGLFGVVEAASGLANIITPNIWRLPVAQLQTPDTTTKLAASAVLLPHWGGTARALAGVILMAGAGWQAGLGPATLALLPTVLLLAWITIGLSAAVARAAVARPDVDVFQLVIRWRGDEIEIPPLSLSASVLQFWLGILTIPAVKVFSPLVLYQPELGPSAEAFLVLAITATVTAATVILLWRSRLDWHAPAAQQREAVKNA